MIADTLTTDERHPLVNYDKWLAERYVPIEGGALESNINGIWFAKQTAKGAAVSAFTKRGRWVGGDLQVNRADGSEVWSDQTLFSDTVDFVNTLIGNGAPVLQAQPSLVAYLSWLACGQETVTGGVTEIQSIPTGTATGGTFTINVPAGPALGGTQITSALAFNATAAQIQTALQAILGAGNVTCSGGPISTAPVVCTFAGALTFQPIGLMTLTTTGLTGGTIGAVTRTATGAGFQHVAVPADTGGFFFGCFKSVGKTVVHRSQFNDCRMQSLRLEGSSASKVCKVTPSFISIDPGQGSAAADPTPVDDGSPPLIYTEAQGQFVIDGVTYSGQSSFAVVFNWAYNEYYGDDVVPYDVINGQATATLEGLTVVIDSLALTRYNNQIYGKPAPGATDRPIKVLPPNGSYVATFNKVNQLTGQVWQSLKVELFGIKWSPDLNIPANPAGGAVEFALAGAMRKVAGQPAFRITTVNRDAAYTS